MQTRVADPDLRLFVAIFGGVTLILLLVAGGLAAARVSFMVSAERATGQVVALDYRENDEGAILARPVVTYEVNGDEYRVAGDNWSNPPGYRVGDPIEVRFPKGQPRAAQIDSFLENWLAPLIVGFIGSVFAFFTIAFWWISRGFAPKQRKRA